MQTTAIISAILALLSGVGIFLIACQMMSSNLEAASSAKLKKLFSKTSSNKLLGVGIGAASTAVIQSSGATTVMAIGFVNAGIISLFQAATIIYGANIGTTITAQIVALGMFGKSAISSSAIFSAFVGIGAFLMMFAKGKQWKILGGIFSGFGMLFVGLALMSGSMEEFAAQESVKVFLSKISNPLLLVLIGTVFTAIIQSSSVMTSIALAMVVTRLISLDQGILITMGSNIGSCIVAIIAGATGSKNARRTALIHLLFNCTGVVIFMTVGWIMGLVTSGATTYGTLFEDFFPGVPQTQLAMFHTFFNVATVALMLPLTNSLVSVVKRFIPDKETIEEDKNILQLKYVNENMLKSTPIAVEQTKKEILRMADIALENVNHSLDIIMTMDFSSHDTFKQREKELDFMNQALVDFTVKLQGSDGLSEKDKLYLSTIYRTVRDLERIGDYAENIVEYALNLNKSKEHFSAMALKEIEALKKEVNQLYSYALTAYKDEDFNALDKANILEEEIDDFTDNMELNHINRLANGICTPTVGAQYLSLSSDVERIADHLINVAKSIRQLNSK